MSTSERLKGKEREKTYLLVEKLKDKDLECGYDMRLKSFEDLENAVLYAFNGFMRCDLPFDDYSKLYECRIYEHVVSI